MIHKSYLPYFVALLLIATNLQGQNDSKFNFGDGIGVVAPDSSISLNFNINLQNRMDFATVSTDDLSIGDFSAQIKRFRMKFSGFIMNPQITYKIQLAMAPRRVSNLTLGQAPRVMYDAVFYYQFNNGFKLGFGQTALPGNRQRINSSTSFQMVDRSRANSVYNLDLDFGLHGTYKINQNGKQPLTLHGAITTGEGQNWVVVDEKGLSYTGRLDWYPLGTFISNGAYKESDLEWHPQPRLMAGISYNYNDDAQRTGGQRGDLLSEYRDISTLFADFILKYQGWSFQGGYYLRDTENPIVPQSDEIANNFVHIGEGYNFQFGKYFRSKWEVAGQIATVTPGDEISEIASETRDWTIGLNRYINGRAIKLQADFTLHQSRINANEFDDHFGASLQAQIGF